MIKEGDRVRVLVEKVGIEGLTVPAGTVGTVVDDVHAPDSYAVDVRIGDRFDNIDVSGEQIETVTSATS